MSILGDHMYALYTKGRISNGEKCVCTE